MSFADFYFKRFKSFHYQIPDLPIEKLDFIVTIPAIDEPNLEDTLISLFECHLKNLNGEIIICINSNQRNSNQIIENNRNLAKQIDYFAKNNNSKNLSVHYILIENIPSKYFGPGYARKIAMDTALFRFNLVKKPQGLIISLDADTLVEKNYFYEICNFFNKNIKINAANIYFEHPIDEKKYGQLISKAITIYEIYLRYFIEAQRYANFPYAFHTIGSAFVVKAQTYAQVGGMVLNNSGEDFYFLHKIIPQGFFGEINNTCVYPSPRISDRIVFGTGVAVKKIIEQNDWQYNTFCFEAFEILKIFFNNISNFYISKSYKEYIYNNILLDFLEKNKFDYYLNQMISNSSNFTNFSKRFFYWFNAFLLFKFLNYYHSIFPKKCIVEQTNILFSKIGINNTQNCSEMLFLLREKQKTNYWQYSNY